VHATASGAHASSAARLNGNAGHQSHKVYAVVDWDWLEHVRYVLPIWHFPEEALALPAAGWTIAFMDNFQGFGPTARTWFEGLEADNSREYFAATRAVFDTAVRGQMEALLAEQAAALGGEPRLFRQNRDVRFSADKSPYKTNTYGVILGSPLAERGLYASISAAGLVAGSGYHVLGRDQLARYRAAVAADASGDELERLVAAAAGRGLEVWGDSLKTAPRGYPREHPRIELLRRTSLAVGATLPFGRGIRRRRALEFTEATWRSAAPVTAWLDRHVGATTLPMPHARARAGQSQM
jgi:uncharacterized protein (TIGR02453 family)